MVVHVGTENEWTVGPDLVFQNQSSGKKIRHLRGMFTLDRLLHMKDFCSPFLLEKQFLLLLLCRPRHQTPQKGIWFSKRKIIFVRNVFLSL